jgi:hypothetical protein
MKKEHIALMQLESTLNNLSAIISEDEDRVKDAQVWFEHFDEILVKLIDHRVLAKLSYPDVISSVDWENVRKVLSSNDQEYHF